MRLVIQRSIGLIVAMLSWAPAAGAVVLAGSDVTGQPGETVEIAVILDSGGDRVAATQNDLEIVPPLHLDSADDCGENPAIGKEGTFAIVPCESGGACVRLRALIFSFDNVDVIPEGSVLYRCRIAIDANAANGLYRVPVTDAGASDPDGNSLPTEGLAGRIAVGEDPAAVVQLDNIETTSGSFVPLRARYTGFVDVGTVTNHITLSDAVRITSTVDGEPSCTGLVPGATAHFAFLPERCMESASCDTVRSTISASVPLPLAEPLYECTLFPSPLLPPGSYVIDCPSASGSAVGGAPLDVSCQSATMLLQRSENTPTPTATGGPPAATPTFTAAVVTTVTPRRSDDGGCQAASPSGTGSLLPLLGPALLLAWRARRDRCVSSTRRGSLRNSRRAGPVRGSLIGAIVAVLLCSAAARAAVLRGSDVAANGGDLVDIDVTLSGAGNQIAGIQADLEVRPPLSLSAGAESCVVNPAIGKSGFFNLQACEGGGAGCLRLRAIVLSLDSVDPIPDESELFRCQLSIDAGAPDGAYRVPITNTEASDAEGDPVILAALGGRVNVGDAPTALVRVDGSGAAQTFFQLPVRLVDAAGAATVTVDLVLSDALRVTSGIENAPGCQGVLAGAETVFAFQPPGCSPDEDTCVTLRATLSASDPLPSDAVLFQCLIFPLAVIESGDYAADCAATAAAGDGAPISAFCQPDVLRLTDSTPVPTSTSAPAVTPSPAATGVRASPSPTGALRATATTGPAPTASDDDDGGCQIARGADAGSILPLLIAGLLLAWRARRAATVKSGR